MSTKKRSGTAAKKAKPARGSKRSQPAAPSAKARQPKNARNDQSKPVAEPRVSKKATILSLLQRQEGASIEELTAATGWQVHSLRAALTGLRKQGQSVERQKDDGGNTRYRIAGAA
jgi:hypothetical protein